MPLIHFSLSSFPPSLAPSLLPLLLPRFPSFPLPFPCSFPPFLVPSLPSPCFNIPSQYLPLSILLFFNFYKYLLFILEIDLFWGLLRYLSLCSSTRWRSRLRSRRAFCRLPSSPVPLPSP